MQLTDRIKSKVTLSDDLSSATVTYTFRGLDEAEAFKTLVDTMLSNCASFLDKSNEMDEFCIEHDCVKF